MSLLQNRQNHSPLISAIWIQKGKVLTLFASLSRFPLLRRILIEKSNNLQNSISLTLESMYNSVTQNWHFKLSDTISPILLAIGIFALKKVIELTTNKFTKGLKFQTEAERKKLPDSIFCVLVYGGLWLWEAKIVFEYDFFMNPAGCFTNWSDERLKKTPASVNWLYVTVLGFYFEELFSCIMISKSHFWYNDNQ